MYRSLLLQVSAKLMAEKEGSPTDRKVLTLLSNCGHTRSVLVRPQCRFASCCWLADAEAAW